jgi:anti-sigma B factor antagonist
MLIITVETSAANLNCGLDGPFAGIAGKAFLPRGNRPGNRLDGGRATATILDRVHATSETDSRSATLRVEGTLRAPVDDVLRVRVEALLQQGVRRVLLDLSGLSDIDAAGVGELIHIVNVAVAAGGAVEIAGVNRRVHHVLEVVGVLKLLTAGVCSVAIEEQGLPQSA